MRVWNASGFRETPQASAEKLTLVFHTNTFSPQMLLLLASRQRVTKMSASAVVTYYVLCPNFACGDPVGGWLPQPPERRKLTCHHCNQTFTYEEKDVHRGIVSYDSRADRWKVALQRAQPDLNGSHVASWEH